MSSKVKLSLVIPIYNEDPHTLLLLSRVLQEQSAEEKIIVDASPGVSEISIQPIDGLVYLKTTIAGRARQMNLGALAASGRWLFFLHADSILPFDIRQGITADLHNTYWGRFDVEFSATGPIFRMIAALMNMRSRWTGICTGDQGLLLRRDHFLALGGFKHLALMEDIDFSARIKRYERPGCIGPALVTSARRWKQAGVVKTIVLMWCLRLLYWFGVDSKILKRAYRDVGKR